MAFIPEILVTRYKRCFSVYCAAKEWAYVIYPFNKKLVDAKFTRVNGRTIYKEGDKYFIECKREDKTYYINTLYDEFKAFVETVNRNRITAFKITETHASIYPVRLQDFPKHKLNLVETDPEWTFQNEVINKATEANRTHSILEIQTGRGKTKMFMKIAVLLRKRILFISKASYGQKTLKDFSTDMGLKPGELVNIQGADSLDTLIQMAKDGKINGFVPGFKTLKAVVISSHTLDGYISKWLNTNDKMMSPMKLLDFLGIGITVYDEVHQLFRMNYYSYMMLNPTYVIDLSATIKPETPFEKERYLERLPLAARINIDVKIHSSTTAIFYGMSDKKQAHKLNRMSMYNHIKYEQYLLSRAMIRDKYFDMCDKIIERYYLTDRKDHHKALILFSSIDMCNQYRDHLRSKYKKDKTLEKLKIKRYIYGDSYEAAKASDVIISTLGKSGTAVDYPGLTLTLCTVAITKESTNLQVFGRNRKMLDGSKEPVMVYLICRDIQKHVKYHNRRKEIYAGRTSKYMVYNSSFFV